MRRWLAALLLFATAARAEDVDKRDLPDYDGRGGTESTFGEDLLVVPRVIAFPLYVVTEIALRQPMKFLLTTAERGHWPLIIQKVILERPYGIVPTAFIDLGFTPRVGFYFWYDDLGTDKNDLRATGTFWSDAILLTVMDRWILPGDTWRILTRGSYVGRDDNLFFGLGPSSRRDHQSRFEVDRYEASLGTEWRPGGANIFALTGGYRVVDFGPQACCSELSVADRVAMGDFTFPPGFARGIYHGPFTRLRIVVDSRAHAPSTGAGITLDAEQGSDVGNGDIWVRTNLTAGGSVDVTGTKRVLGLYLNVQFAEPINGSDVPFTEQATLGGAEPMPGFIGGRLVDRSAIALVAQYEWPIWVAASGTFHAGVGNVFGPHLDGFAAEKLRFSTGMGIRTTGSPDHRLEILFGIGSDPFNEGLGIDWVRIALGGVTAF